MKTDSYKNNFATQPLLLISVSFSMGIVAAYLLNVSAGLILITSLVLAVLSYVFRDRIVATLLVVAVFFGLGAFALHLEKTSPIENRVKFLYDSGRLSSGEPIEIEGKLIRPPEPVPEGYFLLINSYSARSKSLEQTVSGVVRIFVPLQGLEAHGDFERLSLSYGSQIRVACLLEREDRFLNPGVISRKHLLDSQRIDATANLKSPLLIEKIGDGRNVDRAVGAVLEVRVNAIVRIRELFTKETAGVLIASLLGNKYFLDKKTADIFREGGTFHVLVISGLHITFIGGLILLLARRFTSRRWVQALTTLSVLWFYGLAVGGDVPVVRACLMFSILMIAYVEYRTINLLNALGLSALLLLAWRPSDLFEPSFQLTFVSVFAIIALGLPLIAKLRSVGTWMPSHEHPFPPSASTWICSICESIYWNEARWTIEQSRQIWSAKIIKKPIFDGAYRLGVQNIVIFVFESTIVSLAVQICLLPLLVYYFHRFPLVSIPLNLWVGGVIAAESFSALAATMVSSISSTIAAPIIVLTEFFSWLLVDMPSFFVSLFGAGARTPLYTGAFRSIYWLYFVPLIAVVILIARWNPFETTVSMETSSMRLLSAASWTALVVFIFVILLHPFSAPDADGKLHVEFLDVGQGDSAFVTFPNGKNMLIDGGGRLNYARNVDDDDADSFEPDVPRIGETVVSEFLWERGISHIDTIVTTHADADHIQGLEDVVRNFSVGRAFFGRIDDDPELITLLTELDKHGITKTVVRAGDRVVIGGVNIDILNPLDAVHTANNDSIVMRISFGETIFLLTGDIEREAEGSLLNSNSAISANVVKVPHHGSRSSSTEAFVNIVRPEYAVISVGRRSVFGHPHREIFERWEAVRSDVMTTGERGTISFTSDGRSIFVSTFQ